MNATLRGDVKQSFNGMMQLYLVSWRIVLSLKLSRTLKFAPGSSAMQHVLAHRFQLRALSTQCIMCAKQRHCGLALAV